MTIKWFGLHRVECLGGIMLLLVLAGGLVAQEQVFRVDVRLVRLLATVKDSSGQLVGDLSKEHFTVYDNGVKQEIALFEHHTEQPLSVAVLVDTSASTAAKLKEETGSVIRFLDTLFKAGNPADTAALYSFNQDVMLETTFTRRLAKLQYELKQMKPEAGTSLYDAVYFASRALEDRDGRRVVVVVTDGADTTSNKNFRDAVESAHLSDAVIYGIMIIPVTNDPGRHIAGENALISLSIGTGGRVFASTLGEMLDTAFADILRDLRTQYLIGYYPKNLPYTKDPFHRIEVKMGRPNLQVVTRSGYYGRYEDSTQRGYGRRGASRKP